MADKLIVVRATVEFVMVVDDTDNQYHHFVAARDCLREACNDTPREEFDINLSDFDPLSLPHGWDLRCLPYGGDGNKTTKDYL